MRKLELYHGSRKLNFQDIDANFLNKYEAYLIREEKLAHNYVQLLFRAIRRLFTEAKKKRIIDFYPFGEYEMLSYIVPQKDIPTKEELEKIKMFETGDKTLLITKHWFVFGCYSGLRISDWQRFNKASNNFIKKGRLALHPRKKSTGTCPCQLWMI